MAQESLGAAYAGVKGIRRFVLLGVLGKPPCGDLKCYYQRYACSAWQHGAVIFDAFGGCAPDAVYTYTVADFHMGSLQQLYRGIID
jgi:hypothetical protein